MSKISHDYCTEEVLDDMLDAKVVSLHDIYRIIAGHSYYYGDHILAALTCIAEEKEANSVRPADIMPKEHPRKVRQDVFLEQWPNAKVFVDGVLDFCPQELDGHYPCQSTDIEMRCQSCRRKFWMDEVE